jgi:hypothetical protein
MRRRSTIRPEQGEGVNAALRGFERQGGIQVHDRTVTTTQAAALGQFTGS